MKAALKLSAATLLLAQVTPAFAQEVFELEEIILYSSSVPVEANKTGTTTEVVTTKELQKGGTQQVVRKLGTLPGVTYAGNGSAGSVQTVSVRGLPARYVPVFFEGIDLTDTTSPQSLFNWGGIFNAGIGRAEVLKGSQSALYGSEAIGGVISLSAERLEEEGQRYTFAAEYGSFNTKSLSFGYQQKTERADISVSLSHVSTDGFSAADENEGNTEADGYEGETAILSASFQATDVLTLGGTLLYKDSTSNIDAFGGAFGDADRPFFNTRKAARIFAKVDGDAVNHEFALSVSTNDTRDPLGWTRTFEGKRTEFSYQGDASLGDGTLSFGALHSIESAALDGASYEYNSSAVFAETLLPLSGDLDLSLAARYEDHSEFGGAFTARAALAWRASEGTTVRASLGNGFRAPSLYELFGPYGNAGLQEERSISFDLGVEHEYASGSTIKAAVFYNKIDNLIGYDFATSAYSQVPGTSTTKGLELSGSFALANGVDMTAAYTYTDSADANGNQLVRVPEHELSLGLTASLNERLNLGVEVSHVAGRANDGFPSRAMADYTVVNASLSYAITDTAEAYLRVDNLLNKEYQTSAGYATSDRAVFVGIRASF